MLEPVRFGYVVVAGGERRLDGSRVPSMIASEGG
jgi:hypothetical protein